MDELINKLKEPVKNIYKMQKDKLKKLKKIVNYVIKNNYSDESDIEHLLDTLLDVTYILGDEVKNTYYNLLNYYKTINEEASMDYEKFYLEIINEAENKDSLEEKNKVKK